MRGESREIIEDDSIFEAISTLGNEESSREFSRERERAVIKRNSKGVRPHFVSQALPLWSYSYHTLLVMFGFQN